ncbi:MULTISPECIES: cupin domain-containing protein [unclassified Psychrobacter]|uniref:cupin domain-containing protein n=1 Tax=unclassified Psychrobacter TaxID=196806 RepID=UPI0015E59ED8|nr:MULTISPECIES: cupin domain-containing protein [unclassified Psychrobacter]MBA2058049.1 cupin domain-containing protein [Psychrobacter sp. D2]|tara:strand:- start:391 stop:1563 length:1173 start_codon:yes stop_codon:yes gene_type:complete
MTSIPLCLPNTITPEQFLNDYWQKKPLLIKQGLPQLIGMFEPEDILGLAIDEDATARLLTQAASKQEGQPQWQLKKNPLTEADFDNLPEQWSVLVQNLEQWSPELGALWQALDFIPQWQRDDIMVSYAPKGGSVGKHYDDYDVFLAQGFGSRRWQLGKFCDEQTQFVADEPIRLFDDMGEIIFDEILEAGDVLYVPPKLAHFGVAQDDCLTFSFGCRRPNLMQIIDSLADVATNDSALFIPMLLPQAMQASGELKTDSIEAIKTQLLQLLQSERGDTIIRQAVSEVVSKRQYDVLVPEESLTTDEMIAALATGATLQADYSNRLLYTQADNDIVLYANGQRLDDLHETSIALLVRLSNGEHLSLDDMEGIDPDEVMEWLENGWIWMNHPE